MEQVIESWGASATGRLRLDACLDYILGYIYKNGSPDWGNGNRPAAEASLSAGRNKFGGESYRIVTAGDRSAGFR